MKGNPKPIDNNTLYQIYYVDPETDAVETKLAYKDEIEIIKQQVEEIITILEVGNVRE